MSANKARFETLVTAIVCAITEKNSYVTKTKLLKLLYLFDVEYYRVHRKTFTGLSWKFFLLGPWASEYDSMLDGLLASACLFERSASSGTTLFGCRDKVQLSVPFSTYSEEAILRQVLTKWGEAETGEILNYVYFETEPMEKAVRNQDLDFSTISAESVPKYTRSGSGKTEKEIKALRKKFEQSRTTSSSGSTPFAFTHLVMMKNILRPWSD